MHKQRKWLHHDHCRLRLHQSCPGESDGAFAMSAFLLGGSIGCILQEEVRRLSSDWQLVGLTTWPWTLSNLCMLLGAWQAQSIVPSFLLSILIRYQIPGTRWAVQVDHLEVHANRLPIVINISIPLLPVYQASHVFTTSSKPSDTAKSTLPQVSSIRSAMQCCLSGVCDGDSRYACSRLSA